jgi:DNA-binding NarL/FixJ family response regulator
MGEGYAYDTMNVLVIDDHAIVRDGLALLLRELDDQVQVDKAENCAQALALAGRRDYKLILLDVKMPGLSGLEGLGTICRAFPRSLVVIVSGEDTTPLMVRQAIERGAVGFIPKAHSMDVMMGALRIVLANGQYIPPTLLGGVAGDGAGLTEQQIEVVRRVARGMQNKEIARDMSIAETTVKAHLFAAGQKLKAHTRTEIVYVAAKLGLKLV